ncbi:hypothetical protein Ae201684P_001610 [Aphanomyces euteiches]|uniref:PX domain-containing protein n=1 Tax=Aphanomyces euteiches TaxID=100861 RepID=A0A6G0X9D8_9STRA|nr:hypothetical protein Ae201684_007154 [Aphanomyces euteiches]KAH9052429.1 hypothetical protein Ae201684P_001610 [Aphanomyces euteiches]KAH9153675.1 hypothetical protein AeRB84_004111 [Aphanomyces euteiches]
MELSSNIMRPSDVSAIQVFFVDTAKKEGKTKYLLHVKHTATQAQWAIERSYSEFLDLRDRLHICVKYARHRCPGCVSYARMLDRFGFPPKKLLNQSPKVIVERSQQLSRFMTAIASHTFTSTPKCQNCGGTAFDMTKKFLLRDSASFQDTCTMAMIEETITPRAFFIEYCRSSSKIECYKGRTIVKVVQVQRVPLNAIRPRPTLLRMENDAMIHHIETEAQHMRSITVM